MFNSATQSLIVFVICIVILLLLLTGFIVMIIYKYQQKQNAYFKQLEELTITHNNNLLQTKLEMQEETFQYISREIHDNIGQKLTLAKLHLNTLNNANSPTNINKVNNSINMISEAIIDLSNISRSMSSEIINNNGLIKATEFEIEQLKKAGIYDVRFTITGEPVFLLNDRELVLFRIIQEAINNIIKHAEATMINISLHYNGGFLLLEIFDNGKGFEKNKKTPRGTGIHNMCKRAGMLNGSCTINTGPGSGTQIKINAPFYENNSTM